MRKIVCLATSPWYPIPTRKQQVMSRIPDAEILYFDPSVTYLAPLKDKAARPGLSNYKKEAPCTRRRISPSTVCRRCCRSFTNSAGSTSSISAAWRGSCAGRCRRMALTDVLLWVYSPVTADLVDLVPHKGLVYDCVDRHSAYGGLMDPALVDRMELELAGKTDRTFATADALAERLRAAQPNTVMIPNGANFERFVQAAQPQPVPEDLRDIPHPIFGFVGALQSCIEYDYLEAAAKARPDWSFVLIGKEKPGVDLTALHAMPNVHFLGLKPNEQLPQYLAHFDACLNLFAKSDLSKDVSPLKFYEYLATGHPIVSTRQPDQILQYAPLIEIADSQEEFIAACKASLTDTAPERTKARIEAGRACSWNSRVAQMCEILQEQGIL